jgi:kynurenine formamidase
LIVESMVNLHSIPKDKSSSFDLQTSPVRIVGATGGPITAYAFIEA